MSTWFTEEQLPGLRLAMRVKKRLVKKKSKYQTIEIAETSSHGRLLAIDNMVMLTERDEFIYHEMMSHVPLFSKKRTDNVLVIGGGDGGIVRECLKHPAIAEIHLCEIDNDVVELSKKYLQFTGSALKSRRVKTFIEDGMKFLRRNEITYDVIMIDSMDPQGEAKKLFSENFISFAHKRLKKNGILCAQSESPFFYSHTITEMHQQLCKNFKYVAFYHATIPSYPFGLWSFALASNAKISFHRKKYMALKKNLNTKYYNDDVHSACFKLPNIFHDLLHAKH